VSALLDRHQGNITKAAAAAGLSRKHLHELIRKIEVAVSEADDA
jgi:DNA-binding NtrC family response regulator